MGVDEMGGSPDLILPWLEVTNHFVIVIRAPSTEDNPITGLSRNQIHANVLQVTILINISDGCICGCYRDSSRSEEAIVEPRRVIHSWYTGSTQVNHWWVVVDEGDRDENRARC